jgi:hypothetical protein
MAAASDDPEMNKAAGELIAAMRLSRSNGAMLGVLAQLFRICARRGASADIEFRIVRGVPAEWAVRDPSTGGLIASRVCRPDGATVCQMPEE